MRAHAVDLALLVIAIMAALPWIILFHRGQDDPAVRRATSVSTTASQPAGSTDSPSGSSGDPTAGSSTAAAPLDLPDRTSAVFLGDGWTDGVAAEPITRGYAFVAGDSLGWSFQIVPGGLGTGYLSAGSLGAGTFLSRLQGESRDREVDVVVLQGGLADEALLAADPRVPFAEAVRLTVRQAARTYPRAEVLLVGPVSPTDPDPSPQLLRMDRTLTRVAKEDPERRTYLSPIDEGWFGTSSTLQRYVDPEADAPNTAGHAYLARQFSGAVRSLSGG